MHAFSNPIVTVVPNGPVLTMKCGREMLPTDQTFYLQLSRFLQEVEIGPLQDILFRVLVEQAKKPDLISIVPEDHVETLHSLYDFLTACRTVWESDDYEFEL